MAWAVIGTSTLTATADDITLSATAKHEFIQHLMHGVHSANFQIKYTMGVGSVDGGSNYSSRYEHNGTVENWIDEYTTELGTELNAVYTDDKFAVGYMINVAGEEKMGIYDSIAQNTAGTSTPPDSQHGVWKYDITAGQVDYFKFENIESGDMTIGSNHTVLGETDANLYTLQDKCIFEEEDTNDSYQYSVDGDAWTKI